MITEIMPKVNEANTPQLQPYSRRHHLESKGVSNFFIVRLRLRISVAYDDNFARLHPDIDGLLRKVIERVSYVYTKNFNIEIELTDIAKITYPDPGVAQAPCPGDTLIARWELATRRMTLPTNDIRVVFSSCPTEAEVGRAVHRGAHYAPFERHPVYGGLVRAIIVQHDDPNVDLVAHTVAHEMGHLLGAPHDCPSSVRHASCCHDATATANGDGDGEGHGERYVMGPVHAVSTEFSGCTRDRIQATLVEGFVGLAEAQDVSRMPAVCGNGVLDEGEECDCGQDEACKRAGCCTSTCRDHMSLCCRGCKIVREAGVVCRPSRGSCDVPETCDGRRWQCPPDVVRAGPCFSDVAGNFRGHCKQGVCLSAETHCARLIRATKVVSVRNFDVSKLGVVINQNDSCRPTCRYNDTLRTSITRTMMDGYYCGGDKTCINGTCIMEQNASSRIRGLSCLYIVPVFSMLVICSILIDIIKSVERNYRR